MACQHVDLDGVGSEAQPLVPRCSLPRPPSTPRLRQRASLGHVSIRAATAGPTLRGSTMVETRLAQMMPRVISSTLASAVSKMLAGSETAGKPIRAAEYPASMKI